MQNYDFPRLLFELRLGYSLRFFCVVISEGRLECSWNSLTVTQGRWQLVNSKNRFWAYLFVSERQLCGLWIFETHGFSWTFWNKIWNGGNFRKPNHFFRLLQYWRIFNTVVTCEYLRLSGVTLLTNITNDIGAKRKVPHTEWLELPREGVKWSDRQTTALSDDCWRGLAETVTVGFILQYSAVRVGAPTIFDESQCRVGIRILLGNTFSVVNFVLSSTLSHSPSDAFKWNFSQRFKYSVLHIPVVYFAYTQLEGSQVLC